MCRNIVESVTVVIVVGDKAVESAPPRKTPRASDLGSVAIIGRLWDEIERKGKSIEMFR